MSITAPTKLTVSFATSGTKNTIPVASQISIAGNAASYTDGFPPLTMTPIASGGIPPAGPDMNGILFALSDAIRYQQAGGSFVFDQTFANAVGGYPLGSIVQSADSTGFWISTTANNTANPETFGANWMPLKQQGVASVTGLTGTNITLTASQAGKDVIILTGTLTASISIIFPTWVKNYTVINNTIGSYVITAKTASGNGVSLSSGTNPLVCDGVNILFVGSSFGVGQTWQNLTSSRAIGTAYTNSTGKPIQVNVTIYDLSGNTLELLVNGVRVDYFTDHGGQIINVKVSAIVPDGMTYQAKLSNGSTTIVNWSELR